MKLLKIKPLNRVQLEEVYVPLSQIESLSHSTYMGNNYWVRTSNEGFAISKEEYESLIRQLHEI
jgi:hypothetical protein